MSTITIDIDYGKIEAKCKKSIQQAQWWLDSDVIKECMPFLPYLEGDLQDSTMTSKLGSGLIVYDVPYAHRLYTNPQFNFTTTHHPLAGANWFEKAKAINKDRWVANVNKIAREGI